VHFPPVNAKVGQMSNDPRELRVVLVTGASSGIGQACARCLAQHGFRVYGTSRHAAGIPPAGFALLEVDITSEDSVRCAVDEILGREGRLDIVVNNAGIGLAGAVERTSIDEARALFDVNLLGALRVCRAVLPAMRRQRSGLIVNVGSIGGLIAIPYQALYSTTKFALEGLTEALRYELAPHGIHVTLIEPGDHRTGFTRNRAWTVESASDSAYGEYARRALDRMASDEQGGPDPEGVARLLYRVAMSSNPRLRYTVGPVTQRVAVFLKRLLPHALLEYGVRKYYRIAR
jgi:NAD(P)-dependent dehydrogenase (short-subunit alcohol dehydrogenase family)